MSFETAFSKTLQREGGYVLTNAPNDRGGVTYAGISRVMNPNWAGWAAVDAGSTPDTELVRQFYREGYWDPIRGDELPEPIADSIYDFAVNSSAAGRPAVAVKLAQLVVGAEPDGVVGPKTIAALKAFPVSQFAYAYFTAKMTRYAEICNRDRSQRANLLGWLNRSIGALK